MLLRFLLATSLLAVAAGCQFAKFAFSYSDCILHHSAEMCEKYKKLDDPAFWDSILNRQKIKSLPSARKLLIAPNFPPLPVPDIPLTNNAIDTPGLLYKISQDIE
jgi:hypothetical protein